VVIALVIGLLLGLGLALLVDYFDDNIYTKEALEQLPSGVAVLALIPKMNRRKKRKAHSRKNRKVRLVVVDDPKSTTTEAYRSLRAALLLANHDASLKTILVTSPSGNEGKTSIVANLGVILANSGKRVIVIDCDLRKPNLGSLLGLRESPGFTSIFVDTDDSDAEVQAVANVPGLAFIGTGPIPPNAAELLGSSVAAEFFRGVALEYDVVLIDSPPLLVSDALVLSTYADALLLVAAAGETNQKEMRRALQLLGQTNAVPAGIVLNKVARRWRNRN
jgi:capsular exopolysaccharide synthesis family protein